MIGIKRRQTPYCRVSTDDIDQVISIELQKDEYQKKIRANPNWEYMGTYVDDGFSGTNTEHRPGFRLMMQAAMEGRLDVIITKSVSRFARNLLDCIGWVAIFIWHTCTINFCAFGDSDSEPLPYRLDHVQIPWRQIRALRNVIAHNYGSVDIEHILIVLKTSKAYAGGRIR